MRGKPKEQPIKPRAEDNFDIGPFSTLLDSVRSGEQIVISLRNNRKILGRVKAFDRHLNMVLEDVCETWVERPKGVAKARPVPRERVFTKLFLRGDSIVYVLPRLS